jgi:hypothetical protein
MPVPLLELFDCGLKLGSGRVGGREGRLEVKPDQSNRSDAIRSISAGLVHFVPKKFDYRTVVNAMLGARTPIRRALLTDVFPAS